LYIIGVAALALCLVNFFGIPVLHLNKGISEDLTPPEFNVTSLVLAIIAFSFFFHQRLIGWLRNIRVTKIKLSEMEVSLEYWKNELKNSITDDPNNVQINGLLLFFDSKLAEIGQKACARVKEKNLLPNSGDPEDLEFIAGNPERCLAILFTHSIIGPEFLVTYLTLQKVQFGAKQAPQTEDSGVLIRSIGIALDLLSRFGSKK
jgi:hypothetical protein